MGAVLYNDDILDILNNGNESDIEYFDDEDGENFDPSIFDEGYPTEEFLSEIEAVAVRPASPRYNTHIPTTDEERTLPPKRSGTWRQVYFHDKTHLSLLIISSFWTSYNADRIRKTLF